MIGFVGGVGRTALTQAGRQIGREFGREVLDRIVGGETLGQILTREEMKTLARRFGKATASLMLSKGKEMFMEDTNDKMQNWNNRMNNFARNLNDHFKQQRTLYAEERNVANKEKIEDRWGLHQAYASPTGLYKTGSTLYVSGTGGKDGDINQDILDDLLRLPTRNAHNTQKYKDTMEMLKKSPEIDRLVGHSLASAVINKINEEQPTKFSTTTYATPTIKKKRHGKQHPHRLDFRNKGDLVSALDGYAETQDIDEWNPLVAHTFKTFEGNGRFAINPGTEISNGIRPNAT